ncbi:NADPH-dependent FMN reductase [Methylocystis sp. IM4]|uniref:NADPH-dependent FMN reductase n=1 Tax=Methylocystis sp. IM4 TaxID=3136560 RepID=UPI00311A5B90
MTLLLIGGSLRKQSVNAAVLATAAELAPANARPGIYGRMADLPHFNPDDDRTPLPEPVADLREALERADALLLSTPEYAGSLPGSFKNLLDWTIGGSGLYRLPVGWINPSSHGGSKDTYAALRIVLERAGASIIESPCADVPVPREAVCPNGRIEAPEISAVIGRATSELLEAAKIQECGAGA